MLMTSPKKLYGTHFKKEGEDWENSTRDSAVNEIKFARGLVHECMISGMIGLAMPGEK